MIHAYDKLYLSVAQKNLACMLDYMVNDLKRPLETVWPVSYTHLTRNLEEKQMLLIEAKDYNDMSRKAANIISAQVIMKPHAVLGLATGSTPVGAYKQLVEWYNNCLLYTSCG